MITKDSIKTLVEEFRNKDFSDISEVGHVQIYINNYIKKIDEVTGYYLELINLAGDLKGKTVIDIGCGFGFFSIVAKKCGAKRVIAIDSDINFCEAARKVADLMHYDIDIRQLAAEEIESLKDENIDIAFSSCFIEHIYDLKDHYKRVYSALTENGIYISETVLNSLNMRSIRKWRPVHLRSEYLDSEAYFDKRKDFIKSKFTNLSEDQVHYLAKNLNKYAKEDLINAVNRFLKSGKIQRRYFDILFNTCDPYTGYWHDKLLNPFSVKKYGRVAGFQSRLIRPIKRSNKIYFPRIILRYFKNTVNAIVPFWIIYLYTPQFILFCKKTK
ncbi:MAG: methyltransferase domain-containing protein [Chitinophagaceae bacterium]|nr:methyltransferase domain-containing protein [Chitinophagaceae bacterium]